VQNVRTSRFLGLAEDGGGGASVAGVGKDSDGGGGDAGCGGEGELASKNSFVCFTVNTLGDDGREKARNAVAAAAASRVARAATRQREADIIPPRYRRRRRDVPAECAVVVAGCGGGIGRRERKAWRELREERAAGRQRNRMLGTRRL
jgi:hypothetical protein